MFSEASEQVENASDNNKNENSEEANISTSSNVKEESVNKKETFTEEPLGEDATEQPNEKVEDANYSNYADFSIFNDGANDDLEKYEENAEDIVLDENKTEIAEDGHEVEDFVNKSKDANDHLEEYETDDFVKRDKITESVTSMHKEAKDENKSNNKDGKENVKVSAYSTDAEAIDPKMKVEQSDFSLEILEDNVFAPTENEDLSFSTLLSNENTEPDEAVGVSEIAEKVSTVSRSPSKSVKEEEQFNPLVYYNVYNRLAKECKEEIIKNNHLQKMLREYFVKRKMYHILIQEGKGSAENQNQYGRHLETLSLLVEKMEEKKSKMTEEVTHLREKRTKTQKEAETLFQKLQQGEQEVGVEIINSREGAEKDSHLKVVQILLKRQKNQLANIMKMRLQYIKLRKRLTETQEALNALDNFGPSLHLIDYEQLKINNRNHRDKLEENENEKIRIRRRCQNAMQVMAHVREKTHHFDRQIDSLQNHLEAIRKKYAKVREKLNGLMHQRDEVRRSISKLKAESGLAAHPKLFTDMKNIEEEIVSLKRIIEKHKAEYSSTATRVENIKKIIATPALLEKLKKNIKDGKTSSSESFISINFRFK